MLGNKICRVCTISCSRSTLFSLLDQVVLDAEGNQVHVHEMLSYCCSVKFDKKASLLICSSCSESCTKAYNFIKLFHKNNELFKTVYSNEHVHNKEITLDEIEVNDIKTEIDIVNHCVENSVENDEIFEELSASEEEPTEGQVDLNINKNTTEIVVGTDNQVCESSNTYQFQENFEKTLDQDSLKELYVVVTKLNDLEGSDDEFVENSDEESSGQKTDEEILKEDNGIGLMRQTEKIIRIEWTSEEIPNGLSDMNEMEEMADEIEPHHDLDQNFDTDKAADNISENSEQPSQEIDKVHESIQHKCPVCDATFAQSESFKNHISEHPNVEFSCSICSKVCTSHKGFEEHYFKDHYTYCHIGNVRFSKRKRYSMHETSLQNYKETLSKTAKTQEEDLSKQFDIERDIKCPICDKLFDSYLSLKKHTIEHPGQEFICHLCRKRCPDYKEFLKHFYNDHYTYCQICKTRYRSRFHYIRHLSACSKQKKENKKEQENPSKPVVIKEKKVNGRIDKGVKKPLDNEKKISPASDEVQVLKKRDFTCPVCNQVFNMFPSLKRHVSQHPDQEFICQLCKKRCANYQKFQVHYFRDHYIRCPSCSMRFPTRNSCVKHVYRHHEKVYKSPLNRKKHTKQKNGAASAAAVKGKVKSKPNRHECPVCHERIFYYPDFVVHLKRHTDQVFECQLCEKSCSNCNDFQYHYFKFHYCYCSICNRSFNSRGYYCRHNSYMHSL